MRIPSFSIYVLYTSTELSTIFIFIFVGTSDKTEPVKQQLEEAQALLDISVQNICLWPPPPSRHPYVITCSNFWISNKIRSRPLHTQCYASLAMNISTLNNINMTVITDISVTTEQTW